MKDENNMMAIFAIQSAAEAVTLFIEVPHPDKFRKKGLIALKTVEHQLTPGNIVQGLVFLELTRNVFSLLTSDSRASLHDLLRNHEPRPPKPQQPAGMD